MAETNYKRKLAAILSADVKGYSRLMGEDEESTIRALTTNRAVITDFVAQYQGRVVDSPGDNLLAEFASAVNAVKCVVDIQKYLIEKNASLPINRRMGVHQKGSGMTILSLNSFSAAIHGCLRGRSLISSS